MNLGGRGLDLAFQLLALLTVPLWLLMIFLPKWEPSVRILRSPWCLAPIALAYVVVIVPQLGSILPMLVTPDPRAQLAYLGTEGGYLAVLAHLLTFDLFVGRWAYLDGYTAGRSPWVMSPVLFVVMMLGPLGLLLHLGIRLRGPRAQTFRPRKR